MMFTRYTLILFIWTLDYKIVLCSSNPRQIELTIPNVENRKMEDNNFNPIEMNVCCKPDVIYQNSQCNESISNQPMKLQLPSIYKDDLTPSNKQFDDIFTLKFDFIPCLDNSGGLFALNPDAPDFDVFYLLENGTIFQNNSSFGLPDSTTSTQQYCLANVITTDDVNKKIIKTVVAVCAEIYDESELYQANDIKVRLFYSICLLLSTPFLGATFLVYAFLPELKNIYGLTLMQYTGCLFIAYLLLAVVKLGGFSIIDQNALCVTLAFIIQFSFLASFFWLNVMCFDLWWTFGGFRSLQGSVRQREKKKFVIYCLYAWGSASILTLISLIMDLHPNVPSHFIRPQFGEQSCWFQSDSAKAIYFYTPMGLTILCNIILFISTALKISKHKRETALQLKGVDSHRHDDNKQWFNLYLKLFIVMGINWSMEIISWLFDSLDYIWYITDLANTLQGLIIFIIFVWKNKIKRLLLKRIGFKNSSGFPSRNSTRSGCHSTASRSTCASTATQLQESKINYSSTENNRLTTTDESDL